MPRRPATITQADVARVIRAAKQAGACVVEIPVKGSDPIVVRMSSTGQQETLEPAQEIVL